MSRPVRVVGIVLLSFLLPWGCAAPGVPAVYRGRFVQHPVYREFVAELPVLVPYMVMRLRRVLGLSPDAKAKAKARAKVKVKVKVKVRFADAWQDGDPGRCRELRGERIARASPRLTRSRRKTVVTLCLEHFFLRPLELRKVLAHEVAHAYLARALGDDIRNLPLWFNEGLATLLAEEGPDRVRIHLAKTGSRGPLVGLVGLGKLRDHDRPAEHRYLEAYLHARFLANRLGRKGLTRFVQRLAKGESFWKVVASMTGRRRAEHVRASDRAVRGYLAKVAAAAGLAAYREAVAKGIAGLRGFVARHPSSVYVSLARYQLARSLLRARKPRQALVHLAKLRGKAGIQIGAALQVRLLVIRAELALGRSARARALLAALRRDLRFVSPRRATKIHPALERISRHLAVAARPAAGGSRRRR